VADGVAIPTGIRLLPDRLHRGVTGLGRGTTVRFNGIDVGSIAELAFDPENPAA